MYREFMKKMIKAKKLEYEAIKEILPDSVKGKVEEAEKNAIDLFKDIAVDIMTEEVKNGKQEGEREVKKVRVDFN